MLWFKNKPKTLLEAIRESNVSGIQTLLDEGVELDSWDIVKQSSAGPCTAFHESLWAKNDEVFELLIERGMKLTPCYHYASKTTMDVDESSYFPALHLAAVFGTPTMLKIVIGQSEDPNQRTEINSRTALHCLAQASRREDDLEQLSQKLKILTDAGIDIDAEDSMGKTAIFDATFSSGKLDVLKALHNAGANLNHCDNNGRTVLFDADGVGIVEYLVSNGCDVNHRDKMGWTALMSTNFNGRHPSKSEMLERLVVN